MMVVKSNTNGMSSAGGQRVTEVAWEDAGRNRGLDLEPREKERVVDEWTQTHTRTRIEDTTVYSGAHYTFK
jgi:hypothetical protein